MLSLMFSALPRGPFYPYCFLGRQNMRFLHEIISVCMYTSLTDL